MAEFAPDVPVYIQLAGILRDQMASGQIQPRQPLPSIAHLSQTYGVADQTVKKAIRILRDEGLVHTWPGKGTFVSEQSG